MTTKTPVTVTADVSSNQQACSANFTINDQYANQTVGIGVTVALQAEDAAATTCQWTVTCVPAGCDYELLGGTQTQATLALNTPGAYVIQLAVTRDQCRDVVRRIVWAVSANRQYRLPVTDEPLQFSGDEEWTGDLLQVITDAEDYLPTPAEKEALANANAPSASNPVATVADLGLTRLIAAGVIDLGQMVKQKMTRSSSVNPGGLRLVDNDFSQGLATLTFDRYNMEHAETYLVTALPINEQAGTPTQPIIIVQFVRFVPPGFVLQMVNLGQLPVGQPALGRCMIEVNQVLTKVG